jgi:hypothetical protein
MAELNWSEAHWQQVRKCVTDAFGEASVAKQFLDEPKRTASGSTETVRNERLVEDVATRTVDSTRITMP